MKIKHTDYSDPTERANAEKREAAMREQRLAAEAVASRVKAFADAARAGDLAGAARVFLAEPGDMQKLQMIRELEGAELMDLLRAAKREFREAILAAHPNRIAIERELAPAKALPRFVSITRAVINGEMSGFSGTRDRTIWDDKTYAELEAAGVEVRPYKGERDRDADPAGWLVGWDPSAALVRSTVSSPGSHVMDESVFLARLAADSEFAAEFRSGRLVAETKTFAGKVEDHPIVAKLGALP